VDKKKIVQQGSLKRVRLSRVIPNTWNPNVCSSDNYAKLKRGMQKVIENNPRSLPPIIVRRHPDKEGHYEIIDGEHRWRVCGDLKQKRINIFVIKADDKTSRILTNTLNYLRGQPDRAKYAKGIVELIAAGMQTSDLAELLPETEEDIDELLDEADVSVEAYEQLQEEDEENLKKLADRDSGDVWIDMKFKVTTDQAKVIEEEIARVGAALKGKNKRGRALEYAMVMSSQCDLPKDL
jgi:ParB/RepB/Spo0J family partition protein